MKICSRCNIEKDDSQFRWRYDKRGRGSRALKYLNNTCRKCDAEISNKHYFKNKDDKQWYEDWKKKSRDYNYAHPEKVSARLKAKRETPEYKKMMRDYREKNKEKIFKQGVISKRRYQSKHMENVTDEYISMKLFNKIDREFIKNYPELIQAKRLQILIKRKMYNNVKN